MVVEFEIEGQTFTALNGGPSFKFTEAVSLQVRCETKVEVDYFWGKLTNGGQEGSCGGWKDKYGLSWQVVPAAIPEMMMDPDPAKSECHERFLENEKARHGSDRARLRGAATMKIAPYGEASVALTRVFDAPRALV